MNHISRKIMLYLVMVGIVMLLWACGVPTTPPNGSPESTAVVSEPEIPRAGQLCQNPVFPAEGSNVVWGDIGKEEPTTVEWGGEENQVTFQFREGQYENIRNQSFIIKVEGLNADLIVEYTDSLKVCMEVFDLDLITEPKPPEEVIAPENFLEGEEYSLKDTIIISFEPPAATVDEFKGGFNWMFVIDPKISPGKIHNYLKTRYQNGYTAVGYYNGQMGAGFCAYNTSNVAVATPKYRDVPPTPFFKYPQTYSTTYYNYRLTVWGKGSSASEYMLTGLWSYYSRYQTPPASPPAGSIVCPTPTRRP